jgi:hypothetical protein
MPDFKERAREIVRKLDSDVNFPELLRVSQKVLATAISTALSQAYEEGVRAERERCIGIVNTCMTLQDFITALSTQEDGNG